MTGKPGVHYELAGGRVVPGTPWCVECNRPADAGSHQRCRTEMDSAVWTPCLSCLGGGVATDGRSCPDCRGLGFWEADSLPAMVGGYTVLAEVYHEMTTAEAQQRQAPDAV